MNPPKLDTIAILPTERQMSRVRFSADGRWLFAAGRDGLVHRWDLSAPPEAAMPVDGPAGSPPAAPRHPELSALAGHDGWVADIALDPRGPRAFSADTWGRLVAWRIDAEPPTILWNRERAHDGWIRQVAVSPQGDRLATCGRDRAIRVWSAADGSLVREWPAAPDDVYAVAFHPDGGALLAGDLKGVVRHLSLADGKPVGEFDARSLHLLAQIQEVGGVRVIRFAADGGSFAVAGARPVTGGFVEAVPSLKIFDWTSRGETQSLELGEKTEGFVHDLAFHPDGFWIGVTSGQPGRGGLFLHHPGDAKPFLSQPLPNCHSVALAPDGRRIAVLANAGTFGQKKSMAREGVYPGNSSPIHVFAITPASATAG